MAIEVIPKSKIEQVQWLKLAGYFCLALFLAVFLSYLFLVFYQKKLAKDLSNLEMALARTPAETALEKDIFGYQRKINDFNTLLGRHRLPTKLFAFLEQNTHPRVWFSDFNLDLENNVLSLVSATDSLETLSQQIIIFRGKEEIKNIDLSNVSLGKEGVVEFNLQLALDAEILR